MTGNTQRQRLADKKPIRPLVALVPRPSLPDERAGDCENDGPRERYRPQASGSSNTTPMRRQNSRSTTARCVAAESLRPNALTKNRGPRQRDFQAELLRRANLIHVRRSPTRKRPPFPARHLPRSVFRSVHEHQGLPKKPPKFTFGFLRCLSGSRRTGRTRPRLHRRVQPDCARCSPHN